MISLNMIEELNIVKIVLFSNEHIIEFLLPVQVFGTFAFDEFEDEGNKLINIEADNGNWFVMSTSGVKVFNNNNYSYNAKLELNKFYTLERENKRYLIYVDNIYVYYPLPYVRKIYYLDVDFYRYFIGREDQSVNEKVMISRIDQQIFVTKKMIDMYQLKEIRSKKLRHYMVNYLAIMMTVSSILLIRSKKEENLEKKRELWQYLKRKDFKTFLRIRYGILGQTMNIPGKPGRKISSLAYTVARRLIGFN